jgi:hypothetical protein
MKYETAGDPITGLKWTRKTTEKIALELKSVNIVVCPNTVAKLLKALRYSLRVNHKKLNANKKKKPQDEKKRDRQFRYIRQLREAFETKCWPSISVDAKKRELVGNFKNPGTAWARETRLVNDHDFRSQAVGIAVSYGVYDLLANRSLVCVGTTHDTSAFAVDTIAKWWRNDGCKRYPKAKQLLILADSGGSNGSRSDLWKYALQEKICNRYGLTVTVCHYPPGSSKWNPIEHRLFSEITKNWAGIPLESYETILNYIRTTKTKTGLKVKAMLLKKKYETGLKISETQTAKIMIKPHAIFPEWNYTLRPAKM